MNYEKPDLSDNSHMTEWVRTIFDEINSMLVDVYKFNVPLTVGLINENNKIITGISNASLGLYIPIVRELKIVINTEPLGSPTEGKINTIVEKYKPKLFVWNGVEYGIGIR